MAGFLLKIEKNREVREQAFYQSETGDFDKKLLTAKIVDFFSADSDDRTEYQFRSQGKKVICRKVPMDNPQLLYVYCLVMDKSSPSELFEVDKDIEISMLSNAIAKGKIPDAMQEVVDNKVHIIEKTKAVKSIFSDVTKKASKLVDDNKLNEYQKLIKLAKDVPEKIIQNIKKGDAALIEKNYRTAERSYREAGDLASSVYEYSLASFLNKRAENVGGLSDLEREIKNNTNEIQKLIKDVFKRDTSLFEKMYVRVLNLINSFDKLENDDKIEQLQDLSDDLNVARDLSKKLEVYELKIKQQIDDNADMRESP